MRKKERAKNWPLLKSPHWFAKVISGFFPYGMVIAWIDVYKEFENEKRKNYK